MVLEYVPTFARTKSPSHVGKYTSTMGCIWEIWLLAFDQRTFLFQDEKGNLTDKHGEIWIDQYQQYTVKYWVMSIHVELPVILV
jgi:hypothetical protein